MIDLETLVARVWELEGKYFDLQERYQLLIHQYEQLKEKHDKDMQQVSDSERDDP